MQRHIVETLVGTLVLAIAIGFGWYAYSTTGHSSSSGSYSVKARFDRADGLNNGTDVRVSGIKIGSVTSVTLDPKNYMALVEIAIQNDVKLAIDSRAEIQSEGLLGGRYLNITPGNDDTDLTNGATIVYTNAGADLMQLISKAIFGSLENKAPPPPPAGAAPAYPGAPEPAPAP